MKAATKADKKRCVCRTPSYPVKDGSRCRLFWCVGCKQWRPWCQGGAPEVVCNDCWHEANKSGEAA